MQGSNVVYGEASESDSEDETCTVNIELDDSKPKKQPHIGSNTQPEKIKSDECPS